MPVFEVTTAGGTYPVVVERGAVSQLPRYLPAPRGKLFLVTEPRIWELHEALLAGLGAAVLTLPGGEENKRLSHLEDLAGQMLDAGADRDSLVIAFGGGIVCDMAGFLAAIFMRGIPVIQVPTTLLAQVDASVGGKTGVNLIRGKNLIGSFHQPRAVLIDPSFLATLPEREYRAGLYEVIKCAVIASPSLFQLLHDRRDAVLAREPSVADALIAECVQIKAEVVSADERESGLRRILNFGHTVGHAIEAETQFSRFLHGEAVALGMRGAVHLAHARGTLPASDTGAILELIAEYGPVPPTDGISVEAVFRRLASDKKSRMGQVHFVLPISIGATEVVSGLSDIAVMAAIEKALA